MNNNSKVSKNSSEAKKVEFGISSVG